MQKKNPKEINIQVPEGVSSINISFASGVSIKESAQKGKKKICD